MFIYSTYFVLGTVLSILQKLALTFNFSNSPMRQIITTFISILQRKKLAQVK